MGIAPKPSRPTPKPLDTTSGASEGDAATAELSGELPAEATLKCCPDVATFEGSTGARSTYFGFDDKTNAVRYTDHKEYWVPPDRSKTLPGSKETIDGAR